jgi:hypothetical protein
VILGGPALFLAGHALFKRAVFDHLSRPRMIALVVLLGLVPVAVVVPPLVRRDPGRRVRRGLGQPALLIGRRGAPGGAVGRAMVLGKDGFALAWSR